MAITYLDKPKSRITYLDEPIPQPTTPDMGRPSVGSILQRSAQGIAPSDVVSGMAPIKFIENMAGVAREPIEQMIPNQPIFKRPLQATAPFTSLSNIGSNLGVMAAEKVRPKITPRAIGGTALGMTLDPLAILSGVTALKGILPKQSPLKAISKAEKLTTEVLNPPKAELSSYGVRGKKAPSIEEAASAIRPSKTYTELKNNLSNVIKKVMSERDEILSQNNRPISDYTKVLDDYISSETAKGQVTKPELKQMQDVLSREREFLKTKQLDRLSGQARKEYLEDVTEKLLQRSEKGEVIDTAPARNRALDKLRYGLRKEVEGNNYKIRELNSRYGGLKRAHKLAADQEALAQKAITPNMMGRVINLIRRPQDEIMKAFERESSLLSKTKKISKIMGK